MRRSLARLATLPDDVLVLPGHNYAAPAHTTIGQEKSTNRIVLEAVRRARGPQASRCGGGGAATALLPDYLAAARRVNGEWEKRQGPAAAQRCCRHHEATSKL